MGQGQKIPTKNRPSIGPQNWPGVCWDNISYHEVVNFLKLYKTPQAASKVNTEVISTFISNMADKSYLTEWFVAIIGGGVSGSAASHTISGTPIARAKRAMKVKADRYTIGTLLQGKDEGINLDENEWQAALNETIKIWNKDKNPKKPEKPKEPSRLSLRRIRGLGTAHIKAQPEKGLLLIYLVDRAASLQKNDLMESKVPADADPMVSFACSFPENNDSTKVKYEANNVYWEQEYGSSE